MIFASCNKKNISRFLSLLLYFRKKTVFTGMQHSRPIVRTTPAPMWWCREELNPKTSLQLSICYNIIYHYYTYIMLYAFCAHIFSVIWLMVLYLALKKLGMDGYWSHMGFKYPACKIKQHADICHIGFLTQAEYSTLQHNHVWMRGSESEWERENFMLWVSSHWNCWTD